MNSAFGSAPLTASQWVWPLAIGVLVLVVVEAEKLLRRHAESLRSG